MHQRTLFAVLIFAFSGAFAQTPTYTTPDCALNFTISVTGTSASLDNRSSVSPNQQAPCYSWTVSYFGVNGFTGGAVTFQDAPDANGVPGSWESFAGSVISPGTNPLTATTGGGQSSFTGYFPWLNVTATITGTGTIKGTIQGWKQQGAKIVQPGTPGSGDVIGPASSTANDIPTFADTTGKKLADAIGPNTTATLKVLTQVSGNTPSWQLPPAPGTLTYYLTPTASAVATYLQQTTAPYTPKTTLNYPTLGTGTDLLQNWITQPGFPGLTFIPAGSFEFHIHALRTGGGTVKIYAEVWEADAAGADIGIIGTTETSTALTTSEVEYRLFFSTINVRNLASVASRITTRVYVTVSGSSPTVQSFVGGTADSHVSLPTNTVDASNFVPYTGATQDVNLGSHSIVAAGAQLGNGSTAGSDELCPPGETPGSGHCIVHQAAATRSTRVILLDPPDPVSGQVYSWATPVDGLSTPALLTPMPAVTGSGVVKVVSDTPALVTGSSGDCVHVDGGSGSCGGGSGANWTTAGTHIFTFMDSFWKYPNGGYGTYSANVLYCSIVPANVSGVVNQMDTFFRIGGTSGQASGVAIYDGSGNLLKSSILIAPSGQPQSFTISGGQTLTAGNVYWFCFATEDTAIQAYGLWDNPTWPSLYNIGADIRTATAANPATGTGAGFALPVSLGSLTANNSATTNIYIQGRP